MKTADIDHPLLFGRFSVMNGLRAVTLMWVMFVHLPSMAVPDYLQSIHHHWRFGVDFFLAISGFLVTRSMYQCYAKAPLRQAFLEYLIRRIARIFPPYYALLLLIGALALVTRGGLYENLVNTANLLPSFPLFFANYTIPTGLHDLPHSLIILWSVSFQEQFYFILGVFFLISPKNFKESLLIAGLGSLALRLYTAFFLWNGLDRQSHYSFWLHLNFDAISWGCLAWIYYDQLGQLWSTRTRAIINTALILIGDMLVISAPSFWSGDQAHVVIMCFKAPLLALTVRAACELEVSKSWFAEFLKNKKVGEVGVACYEIYLVHVIVYGFVEKLHLSSGPLFLGIAYVVSILAGLAFYRYFGKPSQEIAKNVLRVVLLPKKKTLNPLTEKTS